MRSGSANSLGYAPQERLVFIRTSPGSVEVLVLGKWSDGVVPDEDNEDFDKVFYCAEFNRTGFTCEEECDACSLAGRMPEMPEFRSGLRCDRCRHYDGPTGFCNLHEKHSGADDSCIQFMEND